MGSKTSWLPAVPQAGVWRGPRMPSSHWGRKTRSGVALEAAVIWFEQTVESPGCSSGIARQPNGRHAHTQRVSSITSGLRGTKRRQSGQKPLGAIIC